MVRYQLLHTRQRAYNIPSFVGQEVVYIPETGYNNGNKKQNVKVTRDRRVGAARLFDDEQMPESRNDTPGLHAKGTGGHMCKTDKPSGHEPSWNQGMQ